MSEYSYVGKGQVYGGVPGSKLRPFGNASVVTIGTNEETNELRDFTNPGGGLDDFVSRITEVTFGATLHDISPENLSLAFFGEITEVAADTVTDESQTAFLGGLVRLDNIPNPDETFDVTDSGGTTTYVKDTDYKLTASGIVPLEGGAITDEEELLISYTKRAGHVVQALTQAAKEFELVFEGLNEAKSGRPVVVDVYKVKFSPAQELGLIGDDFAGLEITGRVLKDPNKSGEGISQYFKAELAAAA